jgi:hypothetical protein
MEVSRLASGLALRATSCAFRCLKQNIAAIAEQPVSFHINFEFRQMPTGDQSMEGDQRDLLGEIVRQSVSAP